MHPAKFAIITVLAAACISPTEPPVHVRLAVQGSSFDHGSLIPFAVTNLGSDSAFVAACGPRANPLIERSLGGSWKSYGGGFCQAIYPPTPLWLSPGASLEGTVYVPDPGRYHLKIETGIELAGPTIVATSPSFEVR